MRKRNVLQIATFSLLLSATAHVALAQEAKENKADKLSLGLSLNHDAFFGFNPSLTASYPVGKSTALTFYGIQWGAGTASAWGNWTEFGLGVNFKAGIFNINPQLGFTMGSLLSSGAAQPGVVGDGIVPNLTVNLAHDKFVGQLYTGFYNAFADKTIRTTGSTPRQATNNYVHYWVNAGVKATPWLAFGAHYENLYLSGGKINGGGNLPRTDGYQWIGPFVEVSKGVGGMRFSFGGDLTDDADSFSDSDFYKLQLFFNF